MTIIIDAARAVELLRQAVAAQGADHVYRSDDGECRYTAAGCPDCIVGHVLALAGVPLSVLADLDGSIAYLNVPGVEFTDQARAVLLAAQEVQDDQRSTWGQALAAAEAVAAEFGVDGQAGEA